MPAEEQDLKVYSDLFEHVEKTLKENGKTLNCDKKGFVYSVGTPPRKISYKEFEVLDSEAFLSCIFLKCFQRLPSEQEIKTVGPMTRIDKLTYVVNKASYSIRGIKLTDCIYNPQPGLRGKTFSLAASVASSPKLRKFAKKLPAGIQNKIRGTFR